MSTSKKNQPASPTRAAKDELPASASKASVGVAKDHSDVRSEAELYARALTWVLGRGGATDLELADELGVQREVSTRILERMETCQLVGEPTELSSGGQAVRLYGARIGLAELADHEAAYTRVVARVLSGGGATSTALATDLGIGSDAARAALRRMGQEGLVDEPQFDGFDEAGEVIRVTARVTLVEWLAARDLHAGRETWSSRRVREKESVSGGERGRPEAHSDHQEGLEELAPSLRSAFVQLRVADQAASEEAIQAARTAAWRVICQEGGAWHSLTGVHAAVPAAVGGATSGAPTVADFQRWLDAVHDALHADAETPGSFGSFEANAEFAARFRSLLQRLGYRVVDERTGLPGLLFHRRAGRARFGEFLVHVNLPGGGQRIGKTSARLPRLRLVEAEAPPAR